MYLIGMTHPSVGSHMTHQVYSIYFVHTWLSLLQNLGYHVGHLTLPRSTLTSQLLIFVTLTHGTELIYI